MRAIETLEFTHKGAAFVVASNDGFAHDLRIEVDRQPKADSYAPKSVGWSVLALDEQHAIEQAVEGRTS